MFKPGSLTTPPNIASALALFITMNAYGWGDTVNKVKICKTELQWIDQTDKNKSTGVNIAQVKVTTLSSPAKMGIELLTLHVHCITSLPKHKEEDLFLAFD